MPSGYLIHPANILLSNFDLKFFIPIENLHAPSRFTLDIRLLFTQQLTQIIACRRRQHQPAAAAVTD
jgi:hypothetical protein